MSAVIEKLEAMDQLERRIVRHNSAAVQAKVLAELVANKLRTAIQQKGRASIAFSGGTTPAVFLQQLSRQAIAWDKVAITLVDERCVEDTHARSNAGLLKESLIKHLVPQPRFVPLFMAGESDIEREIRLGDILLPFDVVHLGMGEDAHTASFFPDAPNIESMLDRRQTKLSMRTESESSGEERITWSLSALVRTDLLVLQVVGARKWRVLSEVLDLLAQPSITGEQRCEMPVAAALAETQLHDPHGVPGQIFYAVSA